MGYQVWSDFVIQRGSGGGPNQLPFYQKAWSQWHTIHTSPWPKDTWWFLKKCPWWSVLWSEYIFYTFSFFHSFVCLFTWPSIFLPWNTHLEYNSMLVPILRTGQSSVKKGKCAPYPQAANSLWDRESQRIPMLCDWCQGRKTHWGSRITESLYQSFSNYGWGSGQHRLP